MDDASKIIEFVRFGGLISACFVLLGTWLVVRFINKSAVRLGHRFVERRLVLHQASTVIRFTIYLLGIGAAVFLSFRLSDEMLLAVGGSIAVAFGISLKDLAASLLAGLIILFDRPFQVGDRITFGGVYGEVTAIGLRSVRLVTLDDNLVTVPNNKFLTELVSSGNAGALDMLVQMDFWIGVDQDVEAARRIVRDALTSSSYAFMGKPWAVLLTEVAQSGWVGIRVRAKVYVLDVQFEKALETDVTARVRAGFQEAGILPPAVLHRSIDDAREAAVRAA